jgi:hypothetical protein
MKTTARNSRYIKIHLLVFVFWLLLLTVLALTSVSAQTSNGSASNQNDPNFPAKGKVNSSVLISYSTVTPPPAILADALYGVKQKLAIGITAGTTGALGLIGVKLNDIISERGNRRTVLRFVSAYYPERDGRFLFDRKAKYVMPWILSMAVLDSEWKLRNGIRVNVGAGVMENHCIDDMKMWFNRNHDHHDIDENGKMHGSLIDIFSVAEIGISKPVTRRMTLKFETIVVFHDFRLIKKEEFKVTFPVNPYVNFIYSF